MALASRLAATITCHTWSPDRSRLALCPNSPEIWIYANCQDPDPAKWELEHILKEHDLVVTGLDWCASTNALLSCAQDRNAFVWTHDAAEGVWKPQLVILNANRAATTCKWSPDGKKFAVGSGAKTVEICYFEATAGVGGAWVPYSATSKSDIVRKHKSTVLSVAWHPNSQIIATAGCDHKCRVFSAHMPEVDAAADGGIFGEAREFGTLLVDFDQSKSWVNATAWSPSGNVLAFVSQDCSVFVATFSAEGPAIETIRHVDLPFVDLLFLSDKALVCAGYDMNPALLAVDAEGFWRFQTYIDGKEKKATAGAGGAAGGGGGGAGFSAARAMFAAKVERGETASLKEEKAATKHEGAITGITPVTVSGSRVSLFSTCGADGRVVTWNLAGLSLGLDLPRLGLA